MSSPKLILALAGALFVQSLAIAQVEIVESAIRAATTPETFARAIQSSIVPSSDDELLAIVESDDPSVSLAAHWEMVRRSIPDAFAGEFVRPTQEILEGFVDALEDAVGAELPEWSRSVILGTYQHPEAERLTVLSHCQGLPPMEAADGVSIEWGDGEFRATHESGREWILPNSKGSWAGWPVSEAAGDIRFILPVAAPALPYSLYAVEADGERTIWQTPVWGDGGFYGGYSGIHSHLAKLIIVGPQVVVVGTNDSSLYVEAFDVNTGENRWRFSDEYFEVRFGDEELVRPTARGAALRDAADPFALARAIQLSIISETDDELERLADSGEAPVTIAARWELVRRTVPDQRLDEKVKPDQERLNDFLRALEHATGAKPPEEWARAVKSADSFGRHNIHYLDVDFPERRFGRDPCELLLEVKDGWLLVRDWHGTVWRLEKTKATGAIRESAASVEFGDLLAVVPGGLISDSIFGLDRATGSVRWKSKSWRTGGMLSTWGPPGLRVKLHVSDDELYVYGTDGMSIFIESFDIHTGVNRWRFCDEFFHSESEWNQSE